MCVTGRRPDADTRYSNGNSNGTGSNGYSNGNSGSSGSYTQDSSNGYSNSYSRGSATSARQPVIEVLEPATSSAAPSSNGSVQSTARMLTTYPDMVAAGTALPGAALYPCLFHDCMHTVWQSVQVSQAAAKDQHQRLASEPGSGASSCVAWNLLGFHCAESHLSVADAPSPREVPIDTSYRWARTRYNTTQRTFSFWAFALTLRARLTLLDQKWSYVGGFTEAKCAPLN